MHKHIHTFMHTYVHTIHIYIYIYNIYMYIYIFRKENTKMQYKTLQHLNIILQLITK